MSITITWTRTFRVWLTGAMSAILTSPGTAPGPSLPGGAAGSTGASRRLRDAPGAGPAFAVSSLLSVQLGVALSVPLFDDLGAAGSAWLRLSCAGLLLLVLVRPRPSMFTRGSLTASVILGVTTAGLTLLSMEAVSRLPLASVSALEFLGPLGVALWRGRGPARLFALLAGGGVLLLTEPWRGGADPVGVAFALAAAACCAAYILLTQRVGDQVPGIAGVAVSIPVAGLVASVTVGPSAVGGVTGEVLLYGLGLAVLLPLVPFVLELLALRRLTSAAFGTLTALEPAIALVVGLLVLGQVPGLLPLVGVACVIAAGVGAERTGRRRHTPAGVVVPGA